MTSWGLQDRNREPVLGKRNSLKRAQIESISRMSIAPRIPTIPLPEASSSFLWLIFSLSLSSTFLLPSAITASLAWLCSRTCQQQRPHATSSHPLCFLVLIHQSKNQSGSAPHCTPFDQSNQPWPEKLDQVIKNRIYWLLRHKRL